MENNVLPSLSLSGQPIYKPLGRDVDVLGLFSSMLDAFPACFLFESLADDPIQSRYTILGCDPVSCIRAHGQTLTIDDKRFSVANPYYALARMLPSSLNTREYAGGLVGYIGYDAISYMEPSLSVQTHPQFDRFVFGMYTDGIIYDRVTEELLYFYYTKDRSNYFLRLLGKTPYTQPITGRFHQYSLSRSQYARCFQQAQEEIRQGNTFQCQIGIQSRYSIQGNPFLLYMRLRQLSPSPYMYFLKFGSSAIIGASPELLFRMRDRHMETFPLAGTIRRGSSAREDAALARELLASEKEKAEHAMLVDLHRNDIGRVAQFGTVGVRRFMEVKRLRHVAHIESEITGILGPKENMFTAFASNFPAGTLTGAPKIESMRIIDRLEPCARGPYGGAIGHFGLNGDCTFAIPIRTLFLNGSYGFTQAASGIVYDSIMEKEYDEIMRKMQTIAEVLHS